MKFTNPGYNYKLETLGFQDVFYFEYDEALFTKMSLSFPLELEKTEKRC